MGHRSFNYTAVISAVGAGTWPCPHWSDEGIVRRSWGHPLQFSGIAGWRDGFAYTISAGLPPSQGLRSSQHPMEDKKKKRSPKPCLTQPAQPPGTLRRVPVPTSHSGSLALVKGSSEKMKRETFSGGEKPGIHR